MKLRLCSLESRLVPSGSVSLISQADGPMSASSGGKSFISDALGLTTCSQISGDGRYSVFASSAGNLVSGQVDTNQGDDVFLFDRVTDSVKLVSHIPGSGISAGNFESHSPIISKNGNYIVFYSNAHNLVNGFIPVRGDWFLYDRVADSVTLITHAHAK